MKLAKDHVSLLVTPIHTPDFGKSAEKSQCLGRRAAPDRQHCDSPAAKPIFHNILLRALIEPCHQRFCGSVASRETG
jgi:hypothetical protein